MDVNSHNIIFLIEYPDKYLVSFSSVFGLYQLLRKIMTLLELKSELKFWAGQLNSELKFTVKLCKVDQELQIWVITLCRFMVTSDPLHCHTVFILFDNLLLSKYG